MRKLGFFAFVIISFFIAAAFRVMTSGRPGGENVGNVVLLKRQSALSCRVPPAMMAEPADIPPMTGWGHHRWRITTSSDSTQFYFDQGINMYYAFHTLEARASFAKALRFDPACAMAYYGKALALGPTINFGNGFRAEQAAYEAAVAGEKYAGSCTPLEKGLIQAIGRRYTADTTADLKILQVNYASAMKSLSEAYSQNADIVALYADALMLQHPWDLYDAALRPRPWTPAIRSVLEKALAIDPRHPGALHFMIHTVEGSLHPEDGIKSAETLADLMPDVAHVVHMPSHIYIRSGNYKKGIDVNDRAVSGYNKYVNLYQPVTEGAGLYLLHAVHMKIACAMMAGNFKDALASSDTMRSLITAADLKTPGGFGNFIQYAYQFRLFTFIRFGKWSQILEEAGPDTANVYQTLLDHFARGMAYSNLGRSTEAAQELRLLQAGLPDPELKASYDPFSSAYECALVAEGLLKGVLAEGRKDYKAARMAFQQAVTAEDGLIYDEPRDWPFPARHYLGDLLLKTGEYGEAVKVFDRDLEINPMNGWSLTGLKLAYEALHDKQGVLRVESELEKAWQIRDEEVARPVFGAALTKRPNIIVILADDMGFSDVGCYGGEVRTPNIDYLAAHGIRYRQFYNTSRCCPTRASLLTGLYNQQAGIGKMTDAEDEPGYLGHITTNAVTLAEVLKTAGYHTAMSGKWHVSNTNGLKNPQEQLNWLNHHATRELFSPLDQYPTSRGFEKFFGTIWGVVDFYDPFSLVSGTTPIKEVPKGYYHTDAINDTAVAYIKGYAHADAPFFLYVAENAPHWPLQAEPEDIAKYKDTYKGGWDVVRRARYEKMVKLGLIDPRQTKLSQRWDDQLSWANNPDTVWDAMAMAVHAAMIDRMDQGIGRILQALRSTGQLDNTLILFLSDNGASAENCAAYGPGFDRPNETRDGRTIVYATKKEALPGPETTYSSIGQRWANVANTPYQYWKAESFEGGIHTPLIAFWPKGISAKAGGFSDQVGHVMDFMKTFTELAGATYPTNYKGHVIPPTTGISLAPTFSGKQTRGHEALFNEHFGARYAREGDWKIVSLARDSAWKLFDLSADGSETADLAVQHPEKVRRLDSLWRGWAHAYFVYPKPGGHR